MMDILKKSPGIWLLEQYGNPYLRYDAGQITDCLLQIKITKEESDRIQKGEITMEGVVNYYDNHGRCVPEKLRNALLKDYLRTVSGYSEQELASALSELTAWKDIYFEFYEFVLQEQFPEDGITVEGVSARKLAADRGLSPLDAYRSLAGLREYNRRKDLIV